MEEEKNKKNNVWLPLLLSLMLAIGMLIGYIINGSRVSNLIRVVDAENNEMLVRGGVEEVIRMVESRYIDTVDRARLQELSIQAVVQDLDPHSMYLNKERVEEVRDEMQGVVVGIGIEADIHNDSLLVEHVISESPAAEAGLEQYDYILGVGDSILSGRENLSMGYARGLIQGEPGDTYKLVYKRKNTIDTAIVELDRVSVPSVDIDFRLEPNTIYVRIGKFTSNTYKEFMEILDQNYEQGKELNLVLDLRDNPGGYLPEATNILNQLFTEKGKLFVYTEGRNQSNNEYKSTGKAFFAIQKVAVLINESSASGSEVIAGAIQDLDRGVIIGRRSYGKGLIQEQYDLSNGGALRLTVARYHTASGRSIQRDFTNKDEYGNDYNDRVHRGELQSDTIHTPMDTTIYYTTEMKRKVYAGGGVEPDIFIPKDEESPDERKVKSMIHKRILLLFARNENGSNLDRNAVLTHVKRYIEKQGYSMNGPRLMAYFESMYLRFKEGKKAMYRSIYTQDPAVEKALDYINGRLILTPEGVKNAGK